MFVRYKGWRQLEAFNVKKFSPHNVPFLFTREEEGVCDVTHRPTLELLLRESQFEIAYERYGIKHDERGMEMFIPGLGDQGVPVDAEPLTPKRKAKSVKV